MNPAIVETSIQGLIASAQDALVALQDAERLERATEDLAQKAHAKAAGAREVARQRRVELGHVLVAARSAWPQRGPRAKGWGEFLAKVGIEQPRAWELMQLVGYSDISSGAAKPDENSAPVPTLVKHDEPVTVLDRDGGILAVVDSAPKVDRNAWCTPKWLADALGAFDIDPCSNARSHIRSKHAFDLELRKEDGLELANEVPDSWRVFVNPPYGAGQVIEWVKAYARTRFCFLVRLDPSTEWFDLLDRSTHLMAIPRRDKLPAGVSPRVGFEPPPGVEDSSPDQNHVLMYAREEDASAAIRRMCRLYRKVS